MEAEVNIFMDTPFHGVVAWVTLGYIFFAPWLPWLGSRGPTHRGIFIATGISLLILASLSAAVLFQCFFFYCGHGAMILPALLLLAGASALSTLASAATALYRRV
jgi:uncharacterized membrane protein YkgB